MLYRENTALFSEGESHPSYKKLTLPNNDVLYYNSIIKHLTKEIPLVKCEMTGGILADEMGLGKTVEVLACILCNPRYDEDNLEENNEQAEIHVIDQNNTKHSKKYLKKLKRKHKRKASSNDENELKKEKYKICRPRKRKRLNSLLSDNDDNNEELAKNSNQSDEPSSNIKKCEQISSDSEENDNIPLSQLKNIGSENAQNKKIKKPVTEIKRITNAWYEMKLAEVKINFLRERPKEVFEVQCLCGSFDLIGNEVICIECNKKQHRFCVQYNGLATEYYCPQCWEDQPPIKTKSTLLVVPSALKKQWISEFKNHVTKNGLSILVYQGVQTTGYLYPVNFTQYDIVLTTYRVLQSEIKYVGIDSSRAMRFERKYQVPSSPLLCLEWWRICLDEAQIVETATGEICKMANKLRAVHRWAVSGTPATKSLHDLYGLIYFLGIEPYNDLEVWKQSLYIPYCRNIKMPMYKFLSKILWRSNKIDVMNQINIPKQTEIIHWLEFSAVEEFFYRREHELCQNNFCFKLRNYDINIPLRMFNRSILNKLLLPLLSIRQACTHPKVVRGKYLATKNDLQSMEDLLEALINKNEQECADSLRAHIASINGLAGIYIIEGRHNEAVDCYRDVLRLIDQHKKDISIDTLPHLHTLYNLAELLTNPNIMSPPTIRDDKLIEEAKQLEEKYIQKHVIGIKNSFEEYNNFIQKVKSKQNSKTCEWFQDVVQWTGEEDITESLLEHIHTTLNDYSLNSILNDTLTSGWTLIYQITTWWDKIVKQVNSLQKKIDKLRSMAQQTEIDNENKLQFNDNFIHECVVCHLRPVEKKPNVKQHKCFMCVIEKDMLDYECLIFLMNTKETKTKRKKLSTTEEEKTEGTWKASEQEIILKITLSFTRTKNLDSKLVDEGEIHLELCENLKKEFRSMRKLWTYYGDLIASQDEISMCKERLRLRLDNEKLPEKPKINPNLKRLEYNIENKLDHINLIDVAFIDVHLTTLNRDKIESAAQFNKKLGTIAYLKTLRHRRYTEMKPDPCPICTNLLKDNWSVLQCGHSFCLECIHHLLSNYCNGLEITCSVCRQIQCISDISYVRFKSDNNEQHENEIQGSHSTKVDALVKCVLKLYREDQSVQILVFSKWNKVLQIIHRAMKMNNINVLHLQTPCPKILEKFKDKQNNVSVLLLPVNLGAKGLNLIEATHIFLVEPLMNPSEELQAVGRVHRIGQTKETFVHKFLIKNTIEENIHNTVSANIEDWKRDNVTLAKLYNLFVKTNAVQTIASEETHDEAT